MRAKQIVVLSNGDVIDFSHVTSISKPAFVIQIQNEYGNVVHVIDDPTGEIREEAIKAFKEGNHLERQLERTKIALELESLTDEPTS